VGFLMRRYGFPAAPVIVGMSLGPLAEEQMRRSLSISEGSWSIFVTHGISALLLGITLLVLLLPLITQLIKRRKAVAGSFGTSLRPLPEVRRAHRDPPRLRGAASTPLLAREH